VACNFLLQLFQFTAAAATAAAAVAAAQQHLGIKLLFPLYFVSQQLTLVGQLQADLELFLFNM